MVEHLPYKNCIKGLEQVKRDTSHKQKARGLLLIHGLNAETNKQKPNFVITDSAERRCERC